MNLAIWLERSARIHPDRAAIASGTRVWCDYAGFARMAQATAAWLSARGFRAGDRAAIFMTNAPEYLPLLWGIWWAGGVAVPVNAKLHVREAAWIAAHSGARLAFTDADVAGELADKLIEAGSDATAIADLAFLASAPAGFPVPVSRSEDDPAWLFYTSGTTGRPKGVTLANRQLRLMTYGYFSAIAPVGETDCVLHPAPLSHGGGLYHLPYVMNGALNVVPDSGGFDAAEIFALAAHWRNASFFAAPTMVRRLTDEAIRRGERPAGLHTITYGGGPMYLADLKAALAAIGPHFAQIYGQGESPMTISVLPRAFINDTSHPRRRERLASVGFAQSMCEVEIRDSRGNPVPPGEAGEVCCRGEIVMSGYWNDPAATARTIIDGWLHTGDVGRMDDEGFVTLLDRSKDLVISGGSNIYPREVEEVLLTHPGVAEVACIGRPDAEWGEVLVAYVVARGIGSDAQPVGSEALDAHCLDAIARFKRPKAYRFVESLPKNNYGKVLKTTLRDWEAARSLP